MMDPLRNATIRNALAGFVIGAATFVIPLAARADNLLGLYVGAGVGQSHVRDDLGTFSGVSGFVEHHTAWKALIGMRPIKLVGAELEYTDFGHPGVNNVAPPLPGLVYSADVSQKAASLFGLLYWPLPLPVIDLYAKAGLSELRTTTNASVACAAGVACVGGPISYHQESTDARFAYGAGVQAKFLNAAVRAEYEQINAPSGSPSLYSLIATWTF